MRDEKVRRLVGKRVETRFLINLTVWTGSCTKLLSSTLAGKLLNCPALTTSCGSMESQRPNIRHLMRLNTGCLLIYTNLKFAKMFLFLAEAKQIFVKAKLRKWKRKGVKEGLGF